MPQRFLCPPSQEPEYLSYFFSAYDYVERFASTESGRRVLRLAPRLAAADADEAVGLLKREADFNQEVFFGLMANGDLAETMLKKTAGKIIHAVQVRYFFTISAILSGKQ